MNFYHPPTLSSSSIWPFKTFEFIITFPVEDTSCRVNNRKQQQSRIIFSTDHTFPIHFLCQRFDKRDQTVGHRYSCFDRLSSFTTDRDYITFSFVYCAPFKKERKKERETTYNIDSRVSIFEKRRENPCSLDEKVAVGENQTS